MSRTKSSSKPARAPSPERKAQSPPARVLDGDTVAALLRDHEASGHLLDYHHTRNGACMMQAALVYLEAGAPLPPLIREWMEGAFQRALAGGIPSHWQAHWNCSPTSARAAGRARARATPRAAWWKRSRWRSTASDT